MESGAEPRDRIPDGEPFLSSHDASIREIGRTDHAASPGVGARPPEKKREPHPARSSIVPTTHHRPSHSSSTGSLDLQAVSGKSGSSISGITVPIRLDALSYLLNSAVMGNHRMPSQMPYYPPPYPMYSYPQVPCSPYGTCGGGQFCSPPVQSQYPMYQPGFMPCGSQQGMLPFQHQAPNVNQCMGDASKIQNSAPFSGFPPQSGTAFSPAGMAFSSSNAVFPCAGTGSAQGMSGTPQSECRSWAKKPYEKAASGDKYGSSERLGRSHSFSSESENQSSPRRGFGKFGDRKNEDGWSSRQQFNSFGRGSGRGRGGFGDPSWRGNSRQDSKEWTFGDRSRNADFSSKRRFNESPEKFPDRGGFSTRGQWPSDRGRGRESSDSWQPKNKQSDPPAWSNTSDTPSTSTSGMETTTGGTSGATDDAWETDYSGETTAPKSDDPPEKLDVQSPMLCSPKNSSGTVVESFEVQAESPAEEFPETEEPQSDCSSGIVTATIESEAKAEDSALSPVVSVKDKQEEEVYTFVTVDGENNKGVTVEVDGENNKGVAVEGEGV